MKSIAIIGAGISGLTTAFLLKKKGHQITIFEKSHRTGGYVGTQYKDKYLAEVGANGFLNNEPKTLDLINQLGLHNELVSSKEQSKIRYLYFGGKLRVVPTKPQDILKSDLLSFSGKMKVLKEMWFPPTPFSDVSKKSVYEFVENHFGSEIAENIVRSALVGIYAGDAKLLSASKTVPKLVATELKHKSLLKGLKASMQATGKPNLMGFKKGMQVLIDKLTHELRSYTHLSHEVIRVYREDNKFVVLTKKDDNEEKFNKFDDVVITVPANEVPNVAMDFLDPSLMTQFKKYPIAPVRTLTFAFKEKISFNGFGVLISPNEKMNILGFLHPKDIFEGRCPEDKDLITVMMGGSFKPEVMKMSTQASFDLALKDLEKILGRLPAVEHFWIWNHTPGISQYHIDQVDFMNELEQKISLVPNVHLNSQMLGGVAINDCIRKSFEVASKIN